MSENESRKELQLDDQQENDSPPSGKGTPTHPPNWTHIHSIMLSKLVAAGWCPGNLLALNHWDQWRLFQEKIK